jgi:outer membrane protein assembly factor BamB
MAKTVGTVFLFCGAVIAGLPGAEAATRIKTVEYAFGSYDGISAPADKASNALWAPPAVTVYLPESGVVIRSAWLEVFAHGNTVNASDVQIRFNTGAAPSTVVDNITGQISNQTGETYILRLLADVKAQMVTTSPQVYSMDFRVTGTASNTHSAKLFITYEYDDQSAASLRTVRFPLYSAAGIATKQAQAAAGTYGFTYNADLGEGAEAVVRQAWFEIHGFQHPEASATDATVRAEISGQPAGKMIAVDMANQTDRWFHYIAPSLPGFAVSAAQTLNVTLSKPANLLGGELVVTYESPAAPASGKKTKTVRYFYGQDTSFGGSAYPSRTLTFEEGGFVPKEIYARYMGTFVAKAGLGRDITVSSSLDGQAVPAAAYTMTREATQFLSHFTLFHSLAPQIANLHDGAVIDINHVSANAFGAVGVELTITYQYSDDTNYTAYYEVFGGQKANAVSASFNGGFTTYFPETVTKSTKSVWMDGCMFSHTAVTDKTTLTRVNAQANETVPHQNQGESNYFRYYRDAGDAVGAAGAAHTTSQTNGTTNTNAAYNFTAKVTYGVQEVVSSAKVLVNGIAGLYGNNSKKFGLFKIDVENQDVSNAAEVAEFNLRVTDGNDVPLTTAQAQALFQNIYVYTDNAAAGTGGTFQPAYDTAAVGTATNAQLGNASVFSNGILVINNANGTLQNPDSFSALQLGPGGSTYYFLAAELTSNAAAQSPNAFDFRLDADGSTVGGGSVTVRRASNNLPLTLDPTVSHTAGKITAVAPAAGAAGFTPPDFSPAGIYSIPVLAEDGRVYVTVSNGTIYGLNADTGAQEWSFASSGGIRSTPWYDGGVVPPPPYSDLYLGNDNGDLYRINGANAAATWTRSFAGLQIRSSPAFDGTYVYFGLSDGRIRKNRITNGGNSANLNLGGNVTSSPSLFNSVVYIGAQAGGNSFFAVDSANMAGLGSLNVGQVVSSPFTDSATGNIYFGSLNGTFYARNGSTLGAIPGWTDFSLGAASPIRSSPFMVSESGVKYVYFGADNGKLYKLNAATGQKVWEFPANGSLAPIVTLPVPNGADDPTFLVFGCDDGGLYAVENLSTTPTLKPGFPVITGAEIQGGFSLDVGYTPNRVYVGSLDGKLYRYDITP